MGAWLLLAGCRAGPPAAAPAPGPAVVANPTATLFVEPEDGDEPIVNELNAAARSIDAVVYLLSAREIVSALENAEKRGVRVRVMLEEHPVGGGAGNASVYNRLRRAGVSVQWASSRFKLTHAKAIVVDEREVFIMTLNLTASAFTRNREYGVIDRVPEDVAEAEGLFLADWDRRSYQPSRPDLVVSPENSRARLGAIINQAKRELDVESEEVQDDEIEASLVAAARRGVRVRLVVSPAERGEDGNAKGIAKLKNGGVRVRYLAKPFIHA
ncbi:MAG: hypothetical protein KGJ86_15905, partial [Chloroflexota bacterium]|nr:hypothetical protein [Chloroflexota bacterium]